MPVSPRFPTLHGPRQALTATTIFDAGHDSSYSFSTGARTWEAAEYARSGARVDGPQIVCVTVQNQVVTRPYQARAAEQRRHAATGQRRVPPPARRTGDSARSQGRVRCSPSLRDSPAARLPAPLDVTPAGRVPNPRRTLPDESGEVAGFRAAATSRARGSRPGHRPGIPSVRGREPLVRRRARRLAENPDYSRLQGGTVWLTQDHWVPCRCSRTRRGIG